MLVSWSGLIKVLSCLAEDVISVLCRKDKEKRIVQGVTCTARNLMGASFSALTHIVKLLLFFDVHIRESQWGGAFYSYRLTFWLFYGYRLIISVTVNKKVKN